MSDMGELDENWNPDDPDDPDIDEVLMIKMVEVIKGRVETQMIDGLYINAGDMISWFERDRDSMIEQDQDAAAFVYQDLINRLRAVIMNRSNYEL